MQKVTCSFCGLPFSVRKAEPGADYFCCSGCALASRIPLGTAGQFPVSPGLVVALVFAFGLFNQLLFGVMGGAVAAEGRADVGARLEAVSLALGGALALAGAAFSLFARGRSRADLVVGPLVFGAAAVLGGVFWRAGSGPVVWPALALNGALALWLARGWFRRRWVQRRQAASSARSARP